MTTYERFAAKQVFLATLLAVLAISVLFLIGNLLRWLSLLVERDFRMFDLAALLVYGVPETLVLAIPFASFFATLFVFSRLRAGHELAVLEGAGMNPLGLMRPILLVVACFAVFQAFNMMIMAPRAYSALEKKIQEIRVGASNLLIRPGQFMDISDGVTLMVRDRLSSGELAGIFLFLRRDKYETVIFAEAGRIITSPAGPRMQVIRGSQETRSGSNSIVVRFDSATFDLFDSTLRSRNVPPQAMALGDLLDPPERLGLGQDSRIKYRVIGLERIVFPFFTFFSGLIAGLAVANRRYTGRGDRGISWQYGWIFLLFTAQVAGSNLAITSVNAWPFTWSAVILALFLGLGLAWIAGNRLPAPKNGVEKDMGLPAPESSYARYTGT